MVKSQRQRREACAEGTLAITVGRPDMKADWEDKQERSPRWQSSTCTYFVDSASAEMPVACLAHPRGKQPRKRKKRGHILRAAGADAPLKPDDDERRYRALLSAGGLLLNLVPRMLKLTPI